MTPEEKKELEQIIQEHKRRVRAAQKVDDKAAREAEQSNDLNRVKENPIRRIISNYFNSLRELLQRMK